jgi:hypothetical protein
MPILPGYSASKQETLISGGRRASSEDLFGGAPDSKGVTQAAMGYIDRLESDESRKALVASSEIRAKYARALDEAALNGDDLGKLKEQMANDLAKVGENFQTKQGTSALQLYTANSELMYDEQANRINVQRAAATARLEGSKFLNSTGAIMQSNPAYLDTAVKDAEAFGLTLKGIRPEQRAEIVDGLKKELHMSAAIASARINPEQTRKDLDAGKWDLSPDQRNVAINRADTEIRARRAEDAYLRAEDERARREADEVARDKHFKGIMAGAPGIRRHIMDDADLRPATREHLIVFMEHKAKSARGEEKKSDPTVVRDLWLQIHAPETDPKRIYNGDKIFEAVNRGAVNTTDANQLMSLVANQKDENNRSIGSKLSGQMGIVGRALSQDPQFTAQPALVAEIQMDYQARVLDKVKEYREAKKNPNDLFNPSSKDFVGSRDFIQGSIDTAKSRSRGAGTLLEAGLERETDGVIWKFKGGDPSKQANWEKLGPKGTISTGKIIRTAE